MPICFAMLSYKLANDGHNSMASLSGRPKYPEHHAPSWRRVGSKVSGSIEDRPAPTGRKQVMTMAKPKTELGQRCPPPPYTRWDQRGKPILQSYLRLIDRKWSCPSLETGDPYIARRHMRLLVAMLVAKGRLSPDGGAAKLYCPSGTWRSRLQKIDTEVRRLKALSEAEYGSRALATAKRWRCPVGIVHHLARRKPELSAVAHRNRRSRARKRGQQMPMGDTWEHRPQGGKSFGWNGNVLTARLQIDGRSWHWPLKGIDNEEEAEALMGPVRVAREDLRQAALESLNCELGTDAAVTAAAARVAARARLAMAIITAGGPRNLTEIVIKGPQERIHVAVPQPAIVRRAERRAIKKTALEKCVQRYIELIQFHPDGAPEPREVLAQKMMNELGVTWHEARDCRGLAIKRTGNLNWRRRGRPAGDRR